MSGPVRTFAAVDLGASSGRVAAASLASGRLTLREVHRFANVPVRVRGTLRWDALALFRCIVDGLRETARTVGEPDAVGVDGWGVDYGLLDGDGELLGNPFHYRDGRTARPLADALARVGAEQLFAATGTAVQQFNTVFQLMAERDQRQLSLASRALLVPDLMTYWLSGAAGTELTNASTTGLLDARTRTWAQPLAARLGVPVWLFGELSRPGEPAAPLTPAVAAEAGLGRQAQVIRVASHDTASAVAAIPAQGPDFAYVSAGTWALAGLELPAPVITAEAGRAGFTNEAGDSGTTRFLRNITGFWLLQECLRCWREAGLPADAAALTAAAADVPGLRALIDVNDPLFAAPGGMPERIRGACRRLGFAAPEGQAELVRCILDSLALAVAVAIRQAAELAGRRPGVVHVVGGGAASPVFCQLVADASELPVAAGPVEAAAWGNVLVQARALASLGGRGGLGGDLDGGGDGLAAGRWLVRRSIRVTRFTPRSGGQRWDRAMRQVMAGTSAGHGPGADAGYIS